MLTIPVPRAPTRPRVSSTIQRLSEMLSRVNGRIIHKALDRVSPLAAPVKIGPESIHGGAAEELLAQADEAIQ